MLTESEWNNINNVLLDLYSAGEIETLSEKIMSALKMLIPFTKGYFILLNENQKIDIENSHFWGMEVVKDKYLSAYYDENYLQCLYERSQETTVYQDSSILADDVRKNTEFYKKILLSSDISFSVGILIVKDKKIIGIFNLFRDSILGDFSEKDLYILNVLKRHIENMIYNTMQLSKSQHIVTRCFDSAEERFDLSVRENEILHLIADGKSNSEISDTLCVSLSTVKKHVYNIFNKAGVNSRTQLLNSIYSQ